MYGAESAVIAVTGSQFEQNGALEGGGAVFCDACEGLFVNVEYFP